MIWLFKMFIFGHTHERETVGQSRWKNDLGEEGPRFVCKCKSCGAYKKFDL